MLDVKRLGLLVVLLLLVVGIIGIVSMSSFDDSGTMTTGAIVASVGFDENSNQEEVIDCESNPDLEDCQEKSIE